MILAKESIDGQVYSIPARGTVRPAYERAVCSGWNHTHEWILFVVTSDRGTRKMIMVMPTEEIGAK